MNDLVKQRLAALREKWRQEAILKAKLAQLAALEAEEREDDTGEDFAGVPGEDALIDGLIAQREIREGKRQGGSSGNRGNFQL